MSIELIKKFFYRIIGKVYVPEDLRTERKNLLLHISDTPENLYPALKKLVEMIKPQYIVHTGDLADNIKLEVFPGFIDKYEKEAKILIDMLEESSAKQIYLCMGNHDNLEVVNRLAKRSIIIETCEKIKIENIDFTLSHFPRNILNKTSSYNLFGHNLILGNIENQDKIYLNGIISINIIDLDTKDIFSLAYPFGTDENRLGKRKIGF